MKAQPSRCRQHYDTGLWRMKKPATEAAAGLDFDVVSKFDG